MCAAKKPVEVLVDFELGQIYPQAARGGVFRKQVQPWNFTFDERSWSNARSVQVCARNRKPLGYETISAAVADAVYARNRLQQYLHVGSFMRVHGRVHVGHLHQRLGAGAFVEHDDLIHFSVPRKYLLKGNDGHLRQRANTGACTGVKWRERRAAVYTCRGEPRLTSVS